MDSEQSARYRREIVEPGAREDEMEMLTRFLGRAPRGRLFMNCSVLRV